MTIEFGGFPGTWKLVSCVRTSTDGASSRPFGESPLGYLTYGEDGFMSAILMRGDRDPIAVQPEELRDAAGSGRLFFSIRYLKAAVRYIRAASACVSYCGRYEIRGDKVVHHVHASLVPDWIGTDLERAFCFNGNTLTLTAAVPGGDAMDLIWERVSF